MPITLTISGPTRLVDAADGEALLRIQHAAYRVEADLIGDDRIPPLHEDLGALLRRSVTWLVARVDDQPVGALAYQRSGDSWNIDRLMVDPVLFGRGVGRALVEHLLALAGPDRTVVSTGRANTPARRLYETTGFTWTHDSQALPGLWLSHFEHA